jgi:hypothetical protein
MVSESFPLKPFDVDDGLISNTTCISGYLV